MRNQAEDLVGLPFLAFFFLSGVHCLASWYLFSILRPYGRLSTSTFCWRIANGRSSMPLGQRVLGLAGLVVSMGEEASRIAPAGFIYILSEQLAG